MKIKSIILTLLLGVPAYASDFSDSETSYSGASILEGDWDVAFENSYDISGSEDTFPYAFFEGNTLYAGNSDVYDNTIDAIVEFFWFQSSIDRGTDFYVAVIKTRATPGRDCYYAPWDWARGAQCKLWASEWSDWGEHPVLSVEAITDIDREEGAFRWDWSIPFESYGIDAYGQVTFQNAYGIGGSAEGAAMTHGEYQLDEDGTVKAEGNVQVKGYLSTEYSVRSQYEVTLYEWDVFVDGRADLMAWDMYLNLGERETQSAYHEYFLAIQVAEGEQFTLDNLNFVGNFDTGWYNPFHHELGISLEGMTIAQPYWKPTDTEEEPEEEPEEELEEEPSEDYDSGIVDSGDDNEFNFGSDESSETGDASCTGCSSAKGAKLSFTITLMGIMCACFRRRKQ